MIRYEEALEMIPVFQKDYSRIQKMLKVSYKELETCATEAEHMDAELNIDAGEAVLFDYKIYIKELKALVREHDMLMKIPYDYREGYEGETMIEEEIRRSYNDIIKIYRR